MTNVTTRLDRIMQAIEANKYQMTDTGRRQLRYMLESGACDASNWEAFCQLDNYGRAQIVRANAAAEVERLRESSGVPWRTGGGWNELVDIANSLRDHPSSDPLAPLRESGVPLRGDDEPAPTSDSGSTRDGLQSIGRGRRADSWPRSRAPRTHRTGGLVDRGVPLREADDAAHVVARKLDAVIPTSHPDRQQLDPILRHGAALTADQQRMVGDLASRHQHLLDQLAPGEEEPDQDSDGAPWEDLGETRSSAPVNGLAALRAAGVSLRR